MIAFYVLIYKNIFLILIIISKACFGGTQKAEILLGNWKYVFFFFMEMQRPNNFTWWQILVESIFRALCFSFCVIVAIEMDVCVRLFVCMTVWIFYTHWLWCQFVWPICKSQFWRWLSRGFERMGIKVSEYLEFEIPIWNRCYHGFFQQSRKALRMLTVFVLENQFFISPSILLLVTLEWREFQWFTLDARPAWIGIETYATIENNGNEYLIKW